MKRVTSPWLAVHADTRERAAMSSSQFEMVPSRPSRDRPDRRTIIGAAVRAVLTTVALVILYYLLPFDRLENEAVLGWFMLGLAAFVGLVALQLRSILQAQHPALRAIEVLGTALPVFILVFASTYLTMAANESSSFSESLNHTDALYFTMTVFSTVGFGDIAPRTEVARIAVTVQMAGNFVVLGLLARVIVGAVQFTLRKHDGTPSDPIA